LPLYPYRCTACGHGFEKIQSFNAPSLKKCPKCGGALERPLTAPGLQFKGSGFYVNDYASGSSKSSAASSEKKSESKAETACSGGCASCPMAASNSTS